RLLQLANRNTSRPVHKNSWKEVDILCSRCRRSVGPFQRNIRICQYSIFRSIPCHCQARSEKGTVDEKSEAVAPGYWDSSDLVGLRADGCCSTIHSNIA